MDDRLFAEALCAWLDPSAVLQVARTHAGSDAGALEEPGHVRLMGTVPGGARAIGLDALVEKFLRGLEVPDEYVGLLASRFPDVPAGSWEYVRALRFAGRVLFGTEAGGDALLQLTDRAAFARLAAAPLDFLVRHTLATARSWIVNAGARREFLEHSVYSDWLVFVEFTVASTLGQKDLARSAQTSANGQVLYGDGTPGLSLIGEPPFPDPAPRRASFEELLRGAEARWQSPAAAAPNASVAAPFDFAAPAGADRAALTAADGFADIDDERAAEPWRNIARWRNECSPYAILRSRSRRTPLAIDSYYGRVFDFPLEENLGIYGITGAMPDLPWALGLAHVLRSPYRKVPCYAAGSLADVQSALANPVIGDGSNLLFRGQAREYRLDRSANAREVLYGDVDAVEPSLLATSTRFRQPLEAVLPAWVLLVRTFLLELWSSQLGMPEVAERVRPIIEEDAQRLMTGLDIHLYAIALAQHYGLPTMGLDVTEDLGVALFFALHRTERSGRNIRFIRKTADDPPSTLYVFAPDARYRMDHEQARPRTTGEGRPERQGAKFLITGWGHHRNAAARHLALAMYLDPAGGYGQLPDVRHLFPARHEDLFGEFLERSLERGLPPELTKYVEQLYWVDYGPPA
jgi:FRG domain